MPVQQPGLPVIHTEDLDYIMAGDTDVTPPSSNSSHPGIIPVFNGADMYTEPPSPINPGVKREHSDDEDYAGGIHKHRRIPEPPRPVHHPKRTPNQDGRGHSKRPKPNEVEHKPKYKVPHKKRPKPIKKAVKKHKKKREMIDEDVTPATAPAVRKNNKRKAPKMEQSGKVHITKDIRAPKRKATTQSKRPAKKAKTSKGKPHLKVRVTGLPDSKQSHTKKKGVRAENKSAPATSSNIPDRNLR
jgi:hypothetical protein